jgi:hypothetical protein
LSIRRSPRRRHSSRRRRHSSRDRSTPRSHTRSRDISTRRDRESSITLKSASPHRRNHPNNDDHHHSYDNSSRPPILHASSRWQQQHSTEVDIQAYDSYHPEPSYGKKWKSLGKMEELFQQSPLHTEIQMG